MTVGGYDAWAAEGRPEHLRSLQAAGHRMFEDPQLQANGIAVFSTNVDDDREVLVVEIAAADPDAAAAFVRDRYGDRVEVEVVAPAAFVVETVAWTAWTHDTDPREIIVWLFDFGEGALLEAGVSETNGEVVITLRGPRYQGAHSAAAYLVKRVVRLARPLAGRVVIDGATGQPRSQGRPDWPIEL